MNGLDICNAALKNLGEQRKRIYRYCDQQIIAEALMDKAKVVLDKMEEEHNAVWAKKLKRASKEYLISRITKLENAISLQEKELKLVLELKRANSTLKDMLKERDRHLHLKAKQNTKLAEEYTQIRLANIWLEGLLNEEKAKKHDREFECEVTK